jgi:hypothetical protein
MNTANKRVKSELLNLLTKSIFFNPRDMLFVFVDGSNSFTGNHYIE